MQYHVSVAISNMKSTEVLNPKIPLHLYQEKPEQARESGSTTKEMRLRREGKEEGGGMGGCSFVLLSRYLPVGTRSPWGGDTRTRRTGTLPTAAGGPPATKESETPWTARSPQICRRQQFSPAARALTTCACAVFYS